MRYAISLGILVFGLSACTGEEGLVLGSESSEAWVTESTTLWPFTSIEVCFTPYSPNGAIPGWGEQHPDYVARTRAARQVLEGVLDSVENLAIELYGWGSCPPEGLLDGLRISVQDDWNGASADAGYDPDRATGIAWGHAWDERVLPHEFAHSLGLQHEFLRDDITQACTASDGDGSRNGGFRLTEYDHESVSNATYCNANYTSLSALDKIALAFLYPVGEPPMEVDASIAFAGGIVAREDALSARTKWESQGILPEAVIVTGCRHGVFEYDVWELEAIPANYSAHLECSFFDYWGRRRDTSPTRLVRSDSKHAAVITAIL